jgi:LytR cell envelope-related transcriptional attenuator
MRGAPIRAAIVVAAVVVGAVVLAKGFPAGGQLITGPSSGSSPTPSASPSTSATPSGHKSASPTPSGRVQGVILAIFNTTSVVGLAACAAVDLSRLGYVVPASSVLQAPPGAAAGETEILYRNAQGKADAERLANGYFKKEQTKVRPLQSSADVPKHAELAIFLGTQYATTHHGGCPIPAG